MHLGGPGGLEPLSWSLVSKPTNTPAYKRLQMKPVAIYRHKGQSGTMDSIGQPSDRLFGQTLDVAIKGFWM